MKIQRADLSDLDRLADIFGTYRDFYRQPEAPEAVAAFLKERLQKQDSVIIYASDDEQILGFVQLYKIYTSVGLTPVWLLHDIFVPRGDNKRAIGRALVQAAQQVSEESGAARLETSITRDNQAAQTLYQGLGFSRDELSVLFYRGTPRRR